MPYFSMKTYGHDVGLSAVFRQHKAVHSHCSKLHGYALAVKLTFGCHTLDDRNWVMDFGGLKEVKQFLLDTFDHKLVVAEDDPQIGEFHHLTLVGLADVVVLPAVGCEAFAKYIHDWIRAWMVSQSMWNQWIHSVEVMEHAGNSAIYTIGEE